MSTRSVPLIVLGLSAVLLFPTIFWPFDYDQGTFAYGGSALLHGARPYIDFWDIKPPNIFYTYAAAFALFGNSVRAIRIFDYLNALLTIVLIYSCALRLWKNSEWKIAAGIFASIAYIAQYYIFGHWDTAQTETYSLSLIVGALLLVLPHPSLPLRSTLGYVPFCAAGILLGISFYFKFPNLLFLVPVAGAIWILREGERRSKLVLIAWLIAGSVIAVGGESLYLAINHELIPLWNITVSETASYVSSNYSGSFSFWNNLRTSTQVLDLSWLAAGILGWMIWFRKYWQQEIDVSVLRSLMVLLLGCIVGLLAVQLGNKGYRYHYAVLLPWADILIGAGIAQIVFSLPRFGIVSRAWYSAALAIVLLIASYAWTSADPLKGRILELRDIASARKAPNGYIAGDSIANYVLQNTTSTDSIFIFGFQPYVYWKSGRQPAVKFINTIHFKPENANSAEREELIHTLLCNPPALFLVEMEDRYTSQGNTNDDSRTAIRLRYPEIEELLLQRYSPVDTIQSTIIYKRR